jgi:hypothetical protein
MWCLENRCQMAEFFRHQPMPAAQAERTLEDALGGPKLEVGERAGWSRWRAGSIRLVCGGCLRSLTLIDRPLPRQMRKNGSRECHSQC